MRFDAGGPDRALFAARTFDVCVIGTGPAGMTLARTLAARGLDVALMEGGEMEWTPESQDAYIGENVGLEYFDLDTARLRMFGGTSGHWHGQCREFDPGAFLARPHHPLGAWPIGKADLDPYQAAADAILDVSAPAQPDLPIDSDGPPPGAVPLQPADPLRRKIRRRDHRGPADLPLPERQPRRPAPRRNRRRGDRRGVPLLRRRTIPASPCAPGATRCAAAASRTPGCS